MALYSTALSFVPLTMSPRSNIREAATRLTKLHMAAESLRRGASFRFVSLVKGTGSANVRLSQALDDLRSEAFNNTRSCDRRSL